MVKRNIKEIYGYGLNHRNSFSDILKNLVNIKTLNFKISYNFKL